VGGKRAVRAADGGAAAHERCGARWWLVMTVKRVVIVSRVGT
jgi:hypothetical protein